MAPGPAPAMEHFQPYDTLANTARTTLITGTAGAIFAGAQNTLRKQNVGAMGILTRSGHIIAIYTGVGATYQFVRDSAANLRQKEDPYNDAFGGFAGGALLGLARRSLPFMLGAATGTAICLSAASYVGGLRGFGRDEEVDEVARKEALRKMRRRPIEETIEQLGEGRGIYAPGWEERRRQRLLAKYGVDVGPYQ